MKFIAYINVMPLKELLDPQGKAVTAGLKNLGLNYIENARIGKHIRMEIEADSETAAREKAETACKKLLVNPVIEYYELTIKPA